MKKLLSFVAGLTFLFLSACQPEENETAVVKPTSPKGSSTVEEAYPGQTGTVEKGTLYGQPIEFARINREAVFQGDIILTAQQLAASDRNGITEGTGRTLMTTRWPYNIVYYTIDAALPNESKTRVNEAIAHWQVNARIRFVVRTTQPNYVTFRSSTGCSSSVGMVGGQQFINISTGCSKGSIIHEIDHALGVWHEQSRADRDSNVTIHWANITAGKEHNFKTYVERGVDGFDNGPFDFGSIMMYGPYSFSKNGNATITKKDGSTYTVQRIGLSAGDKATFKTMYQSKDALYSGTKTYFFSGNQYIRVTRGDTGAGTVDAGYPNPISVWGWGNFGKQGIDAALYSGTKCYFFSGKQYIRVTRGDTGPGTIDPGYPQPISVWGWGTFGQNGIDAALYSGTKTYFFSGDQYIRVTRGDTGPGTVDAGYPKHISTWGWGSFGQNGIDAALYSGTKCYFFSGDQYIRVTRGDTGPGTVDAGYPRHISIWEWPASFTW
jgi:hypothetical protein